MSLFTDVSNFYNKQVANVETAWASIKGAAQNVASNLTAGFIPKVPFTANTKSAELNKALTFGAEKPAVVAGVVATAANPSGALAFAKAAASSVSKGIKSITSSLSPMQKLGYGAAATIVIPTVAKSATARKALSNAPQALGTFSTNAAQFIDNPSLGSAKTLVTQSPLISGGLAAAGLGIVGVGGAGLVSNYLNTSAVKKNTAATLAVQQPVISQMTESPLVATNKYDVKVAEAQANAIEAQYKAQLKGIQDTNDAQLAILKAQNKAQEDQLRAAAAISPAAAPISTKKATKKKKTTKKKAKKKPKKKAKSKKKAKTIKRKATKKRK